MIGCLMIHGYTGGPHEISPLAEYLDDRTNWKIEVPTLPGHGENLDLRDASHESWIDAAEKALQKLNEECDEIYLVGFSMGGMIASYLAAKYRVTKLVLLATAGKYLSFKQIGIDMGEVLADRIKGELENNKLYIHYKNKTGHARHVPLKAYIEFMKLVKFTRRYLNKVETPVLIAQGQQDGMVPYKTAYYLDKEINSEQKEVVFFERSRHQICLGDDKDTLNTMVLDFLEKPVVEV